MFIKVLSLSVPGGSDTSTLATSVLPAGDDGSLKSSAGKKET